MKYFVIDILLLLFSDNCFVHGYLSSNTKKIVTLIEPNNIGQYERSLYVNASVAEANKDVDCEIIHVEKGTPVEKLCELITADVDFIISLVEDKAMRDTVLSMSRQSRVPTIQVEYSSWMYQRTRLNAFNGLTNNGSESFGNDNATIDTLAMENFGLQKVLGAAYNLVVVKMSQAQEEQKKRRKDEEKNYVKILLPRTTFLNVLTDYKESTENNDTRLTVIYDMTFDIADPVWLDVLQAAGFSINAVAMKLGNDTRMLKQVKDLVVENGGSANLLVIGATHVIESYFAANSEMHNNSSITWIVITMDIRPFECADCDNVNALWIRPDESDQFQKIREFKKFLRQSFSGDGLINGVTEVDVSFFHDLVEIAIGYGNLLNESYLPQWVYGCFNASHPPNQQYENETVMETASLRDIMSQQPKGAYGSFLADPDHDGVYFQNIEGRIIQIQFTDQGRSTNDVANWTIMDGIQQIYDSLNVDVTEIKKYKIVTLIQPPFIERCAGLCDNGLEFQGYCIDLIEMLKAEIGFEYDLYEVKDKLPGSLNDQQEWNGLIGDLVSGKAQVALAPLTVMAERENAVDFTVPFYDLVGTSILMRTPEVDYNLFKFIMVMDYPVWICIGAAYFFTSILLWVFNKFSPYSYSNNKDSYIDDPEKREFDFKECLWFCMTSLTPQGGGEAPKNISGRIVAATWWLFGFIVIASYTANLAALLTVSRLATDVQSLDDLALQYKVQYAPVKGTSSEVYFKRMAEIEQQFYEVWKRMSLGDTNVNEQLAVWDYPISDKFTNLWRSMQEAGFPNSTHAAIQRVLDSPSATEGFAYIGDATEIRYAALTNCRLHQVGEEFSRKPYAIAVQQESPLKEKFSSAILKLMNERKLEKLREKWWDRNPNARTCPTLLDESNGINIQNIGGVFIMVLVGIGMSIITLVVEYWYNKDKYELDEEEQQEPDPTRARRPTIAWQGPSREQSQDRRDRTTSFLGFDFSTLRRRSTQKSSNYCKHCRHCNASSPAHSPIHSVNGAHAINGHLPSALDIENNHDHI